MTDEFLTVTVARSLPASARNGTEMTARLSVVEKGSSRLRAKAAAVKWPATLSHRCRFGASPRTVTAGSWEAGGARKSAAARPSLRLLTPPCEIAAAPRHWIESDIIESAAHEQPLAPGSESEPPEQNPRCRSAFRVPSCMRPADRPRIRGCEPGGGRSSML
jgi:hypothetical protein